MITDILYSGSVVSRLAASRFIHRQLAEQLRGHESFMSEFTLLMQHANAVNSHMAEMNLGALCIRCSAQPSGGCCSLYMAGETDGLQMLMNLLAGIDVQAVRNDGSECIFLGHSGCVFLFKPMFCLNYICSHIHQAASSAQMEELQRLTGVLLAKHFEVEQYLLALIRRKKGYFPSLP
jgi:hypothetical protein